MYCKLCGKHLYEIITFRNLFRLDYDIHHDCEGLLYEEREFAVIPIADQLVRYGYLFPIEYESSDKEFLFTKYMGVRLLEVFQYDDWSILILLDDIPDLSDLNLIVSLGEGMVIMLAMFDEQILTFDKTTK